MLLKAGSVLNYTFSSYGVSDPGLVREHNEDRCLILADAGLFIVADGMGGHQGGEVAAEEAVSRLAEHFAERAKRGVLKTSTSQQVGVLLQQLFEQVNEEVFSLGCTRPELMGMGTTLSCACIHKDSIVYLNVGDSRIYRLRNGRLQLLTRDDSLVRDLLDVGALEEGDAPDFLYKNVITKSIGTGLEVNPVVAIDRLFPCDVYLLCSDGLSNLVPHEEIEKILSTVVASGSVGVQRVADALVARAKERGGDDNITVVVVKVGQGEAEV